MLVLTTFKIRTHSSEMQRLCDGSTFVSSGKESFGAPAGVADEFCYSDIFQGDVSNQEHNEPAVMTFENESKVGAMVACDSFLAGGDATCACRFDQMHPTMSVGCASAYIVRGSVTLVTGRGLATQSDVECSCVSGYGSIAGGIAITLGTAAGGETRECDGWATGFGQPGGATPRGDAGEEEVGGQLDGPRPGRLDQAVINPAEGNLGEKECSQHVTLLLDLLQLTPPPDRPRQAR